MTRASSVTITAIFTPGNIKAVKAHKNSEETGKMSAASLSRLNLHRRKGMGGTIVSDFEDAKNALALLYVFDLEGYDETDAFAAGSDVVLDIFSSRGTYTMSHLSRRKGKLKARQRAL